MLPNTKMVSQAFAKLIPRSRNRSEARHSVRFAANGSSTQNSSTNPQGYTAGFRSGQLAAPKDNSVVVSTSGKPRRLNNNITEESSKRPSGKKKSKSYPGTLPPALPFSQDCTDSVICCKYSAENSNCPINQSKVKILKRIFSYLNHTDLLVCRLVQHAWNELISEWIYFLQRTVYVVPIQKTYNYDLDHFHYDDVLQHVKLPFQTGRLQYLDREALQEPNFFYYPNSDNERFEANSYFLRYLVTFELRQSFILWSNLKAILSRAVLLQELIIDGSFISDSNYAQESLDYDDSSAAISELKSLQITEYAGVANISRLVNKINGIFPEKLKSLKICYYPPANRPELRDDTKPDCMELAHEIKRLIGLVYRTLKVLVLDIKHEHALDMVSFVIMKDLEYFGTNMNLTEFQLSPASNVWLRRSENEPKPNVPISMKLFEKGRDALVSKTASLARFLESQKNLTKLCLPCIEYPEAYNASFRYVLENMWCRTGITEMAVACAGLLPENFLRVFPSLEKLRIGGYCCGDGTPAWEAFRFYLKETHSGQVQTDVLKEEKVIVILPEEAARRQPDDHRMANLKELCVFCMEPPTNFHRLTKKLYNLTSLEVNSAKDRPVIGDTDLQAIIKHLKLLTRLSIACANDLTDQGITGLPASTCQQLFKIQRYHEEGVNHGVWKSKNVTGRPLYDLKGLKTLVLAGANAFTDIGIGYGFKFQELKYCHLPYSHFITSWGIEKLGEQNPSLESLKFSGVSNLTKDSFLKLRTTHERLKRGDISRSGYFSETVSELQDDLSLYLPTASQILSDLIRFLTQNVSWIKNYLTDKRPGTTNSNEEIIEPSRSDQKTSHSRVAVVASRI